MSVSVCDAVQELVVQTPDMIGNLSAAFLLLDGAAAVVLTAWRSARHCWICAQTEGFRFTGTEKSGEDTGGKDP